MTHLSLRGRQGAAAGRGAAGGERHGGAEMTSYSDCLKAMFENMDGYACVCDAIYTCERRIIGYTPFFKRKSDGARMVNCIAWRRRGNPNDDR